MTYLQQAVATMADIPAAIAAFAQAQGWTRNGLEIERPGGGKRFVLSSSITTALQRITVATMDGSNLLTRFNAPRRFGTNGNPVNLAPTKLHFFSSAAPYSASNPPYIAVAIEFGFNVFRHLYIGNMVKMGAYNGGEIICANSYAERHDSGYILPSFTDGLIKYLFSARHDHSTDSGLNAGGVNIDHVDNASKWRRFDGPTPFNRMMEFFDGTEVFGGWTDHVNGGLGQSGLSSYASSNILVPINLFVPNAGGMGTNYRFRPIGHVPGVRLIRMDGYEPAQQIEVGGKNWMVFPEFSRDIRTTSPRGNQNGASGFYWEYETSYMCGLAYAMD